MSTPNPALVAAAPSLVATLQAIQQFLTNMGTDPAQWVLKFPGASQVLIGTVQLQLPALAAAEATTMSNQINTQLNTWITQLQALTSTTSTAAKT